MILITRKEAKEKGLKWYFTGKPCVHGHVSKRKIRGECLECKARDNKKYSEANRERIAANQQVWRSKNKEKIKVAASEYYGENRDLLCRRAKGQKLADRENIKAKAVEYRGKYQYKLNALSAKRHASKTQRTPSWLTKSHLNEILKFYEKSQFLSKETGVLHHVDHVVPLQGKKVSGLHVPWNLQILTASENTSKGNRLKIG